MGTVLARAANVSTVRDLLAAGLKSLSANKTRNIDMIDLRVDNSNHASLAMLPLRAVEPDRASRVNHNGIQWH